MSRKKVLLVEDDKDIRDALQEILEFEGYTVATACNGREGIDLARDTAPGLILLDLMMPVMTGWEFLEHRRTDPQLRAIPVVVVTAAGDRAKDVQADAVLKKPIEFPKLLETVQTYCG